MKLFIKISIILVFSTFAVPHLVDTNHKQSKSRNSVPTLEVSTSGFVSKFNYDKAYEEAIAYIKDHEGFNGGKIYHGPAGVKSVGHGHVIFPKDTFTQSITLEMADRLVREDFDAAIKTAEKETGFTGYKKLAVAHFLFSYGIGNFRKSSLRKKMLANLPVAEEFKKWCYYRGRSGKMIRSNHSYRIRLWEIEMYNRK